MWISLGNVAEVALVFAQTDPEKRHKGIACFLVPTVDRGLLLPGDPRQARAARLRHRVAGASTRSRSPEDALLGEVGDGFKIAMTRARLRPLLASPPAASGSARAASQASTSYAKERRQFGVPIASFQLVQEMIADMIVRRDAARLLVWRAGILKDQGRPNTTETSVAKLYATESAVECANLAIQVHGGSGYVDDYPVERYLRDARVTTLYEGTSQIQKLIIGREATGINAMTPASRRAREPAASRPASTGHVAPAAGSNRPEARNALSPELMEELATAVERLRRRPRGPLHRDRRAPTRSFAAGADIKAMRERTFEEALRHPAAAFWRRLAAMPDAAGRRRLGLRARRRLRAGARSAT